MKYFFIRRGDRIAATLLRISLGAMYLSHSIVLKLATFGLAASVHYFTSLGLPGWLTYVVIGLEIVGGLLLMADIATPWVAIALTPILFGAVWVHAPNGWVFNAQGGGWEYPALLIVVSIVVALLSPAPRAKKVGARFNSDQDAAFV